MRRKFLLLLETGLVLAGLCLGAAAWTYTAVMQATDFGTVVTSLRLRLYQNGQLGRGAAAEAIVTQ